MKRKKFCKSDLMIATLTLIGSQLLLLLSMAVALVDAHQLHHLNYHHSDSINSKSPHHHHHHNHNQQQQQQHHNNYQQQPNSFHLSHKIIHQQQQQQPLPAADERSSADQSEASVSYAGSLDTGLSALPPSPTRQPPVVSSASGAHSVADEEPEAADAGSWASERSSGAAVDPSSSASFEPEPEQSQSQHDEPEVAENSQEAPERNLFERHNSRLQAMHELFERRQLNQLQHQQQMPSSQELNPISIGLDPVPGGPFGPMAPFPVGPNHEAAAKPPPLSSADQIDQGLGPALPFGLGPLPHLLGFQQPPFDGPQRGDQSAHSNHHAAADQEGGAGGGAVGGGAVGAPGSGQQKVWPKIFRFTDGRINLSEFEKQKKIRLSNKNQHNNENHIESAPIIFDGRPLKRKSFLILHGGIFSKRK